jgi:homogentisate 1,2-dioxygenase
MPNGDDRDDSERAGDQQRLFHYETEIERLGIEVKRWKTAHNIACFNLTELNHQRALLMEALTNAMILLDRLLTEMRQANVTPSAGVIVHKAEFDRAMTKLLTSREKEEKTP